MSGERQAERAYADARSRLQEEIAHFGGGALPERTALVWDGYIAALLEYDLVTVDEHRRLSDLLPDIDDNPVVALFLGRSGMAADAKAEPSRQEQ